MTRHWTRGPGGLTFTATGAQFSRCGRYRYDLFREWDPTKLRVLFLMLNPSTATAEALDPTLTRCCGYARHWGYGGFAVCNIFAFRATDPRDMKAAADPVGPDNDLYISSWAGRSALVVCGWGSHGNFLGRAAEVRRLLGCLGVLPHALAVTKGGEPCHPLYLKRTLKPVPLFKLEEEARAQ